MQPFPRAEVAAELLRRYPHLAPGHPQNPLARFFAQQGEGVGNELTARAKAMLN